MNKFILGILGIIGIGIYIDYKSWNSIGITIEKKKEDYIDSITEVSNLRGVRKDRLSSFFDKASEYDKEMIYRYVVKKEKLSPQYINKLILKYKLFEVH